METFRDALGAFGDLQGPLGLLGDPSGTFGTLRLFRDLSGVLQGGLDLRLFRLWSAEAHNGSPTCLWRIVGFEKHPSGPSGSTNTHGQAEYLLVVFSELVSGLEGCSRDLLKFFQDLSGLLWRLDGTCNDP